LTEAWVLAEEALVPEVVALVVGEEQEEQLWVPLTVEKVVLQ
jgi:hypothetical protein